MNNFPPKDKFYFPRHIYCKFLDVLKICYLAHTSQTRQKCSIDCQPNEIITIYWYCFVVYIIYNEAFIFSQMWWWFHSSWILFLLFSIFLYWKDMIDILQQCTNYLSRIIIIKFYPTFKLQHNKNVIKCLSISSSHVTAFRYLIWTLFQDT